MQHRKIILIFPGRNIVNEYKPHVRREEAPRTLQSYDKKKILILGTCESYISYRTDQNSAFRTQPLLSTECPYARTLQQV